MRKIAIRIDDITPEMDWAKFSRFAELLDRYGIRPLIGVIPKNADPLLDAKEEKNPAFADLSVYAAWLKERKEAGWTIALHGYRHVYRTKRAGLFPLNSFSEYAGRSYEWQRKALYAGRKKLRAMGVDTDIFMAPGHSFDATTLRALKECGFRYVTDGYGNGPFQREGLTFLPISFLRSRELKAGSGVTTFVVHTWEMEEEDFRYYEKLFSEQRECFIDYSELLKMRAEKRSILGDGAEYLAAGGKQLAGSLMRAECGQRDASPASRAPERSKITVLQVIGGLSMGGAESRIMDILRNLDREHFQYDFLLNEPVGCYEEEAKKLGCHVYRTVKYNYFNRIRYEREMRDFFRSHPGIDIVQGHSTNTAALYLPIAKKAGVPVTIAHARSAGVEPGIKGWLKKRTRQGLAGKTDYCWACSGEAADAVFGKDAVKAGKVRIIPNAVDVDRFEPTKEHLAAGEALRRELKIEDKLVVGHVGRFHYAKNHPFLLECFAEIRRQLAGKQEAVLLLVGEGELEKEIRDKAKELGLGKNVIFAGRQEDPAPYYQAMDILVFPSHYEGLPGTIVESQASGLPALVSDGVTKDVKVTELAEYLPLEKSPAVWAEKALKLADSYPRGKRPELGSCTEKLRKTGFDVKGQVHMLEDLYREMLDAKDR